MLVEDRLRQFRTRRAVLRTIVRQPTTAERASLMHKLVSMSDDDRDQIISRFREFVPHGPDVRGGARHRREISSCPKCASLIPPPGYSRWPGPCAAGPAMGGWER